MKFAFVILHYNERTLEDTQECVDSIRSVSVNQNYHITIVENGSKDRSLSVLKTLYDESSDISLVHSKENLGFANGNNLGCRQAIEEINPDFLIVINNDTVITQEDFVTKIQEIYNTYHFHILGPNIRDRNNHPQNPILEFPISIEQLDKGIRDLTLKLEVLNKSCFLYWLKYKRKKAMKRLVKNILLASPLNHLIGHASLRDKMSRDIQEGIGLHGAALIFSKEYYEMYKDVFYSGTFMYKEEDILYYRVKKHGLRSIYHPGIVIYHKEDRSTDSRFKIGCSKERFIIKNQLASFKVYRDYIRKDLLQKGFS
ncbi:glycosyltransferase family 2 protein [Oceanispirochaeta crateris]|uniref:Glycosyltransferase family 2 protein n=1 Tax=Oceanispirochaeta crateris TaxID=2518645 RepID=A0A5C1QK74_9SPIO|nr:glycosyltransferase [Oceanispirochaeta crateris]QEN06994.1 glycosyltransferase family 2 protein [Oceanispirochaeta crateris]